MGVFDGNVFDIGVFDVSAAEERDPGTRGKPWLYPANDRNEIATLRPAFATAAADLQNRDRIKSTAKRGESVFATDDDEDLLWLLIA